MSSYENIIDNTISWAKNEEDIRALLIVGSRAREYYPADEWSDLDLVIITRNPKVYIQDTGWIKLISEPEITFIEGTAVGNELEVRVLFDGGLDVDFAIVPLDIFVRNINVFSPVATRGIKVLIDKEGMFSNLNLNREKVQHKIPSGFEFTNLINDFWYHSVWTTKKLLRGEIWTAKLCCDVYMKNTLLRMIEWHSLSRNNWDYDVWHSGRFLEQWADPRIIEGLKKAYAYYDKKDIERTLLETMNLFRMIATETSETLGYNYPENEDRYATELVRELLGKDFLRREDVT